MVDDSQHYLYTDMVGSSRHWEQFPALMEGVLHWHDSRLEEAVRAHGGTILHTLGDGICAAFKSAADAAEAAVQAQCMMRAREGLTEEFTASISLRMAIFRATEASTGLQSMGRTINLLSRLVRAANGGQILAAGLDILDLRASLPDGFRVTSLGSVRLRDLSPPEEVWQVSHDLLGHVFPPVVTVLPASLSLPVHTSTFIGRASELAELQQRFRKSGTQNLVTLVGFGGVGKTRLALQSAMQNADWFAHGVRMVSLASLHDAEFLSQIFATAFGVVPTLTETYETALMKALRNQEVLMIVDNCEHLKDEAAVLIDRIMQQCCGVSVLCTSREPLGLPGEQIFSVSTLQLPPTRDIWDREAVLGFDACRLLIDRAHAQHRLQLESVETNAAIVSVCRRLDGIPLAIELAAARLSELSIRELDREMDRRFQLLAAPEEPSTPHHRTLYALVDWSYGLLGKREQVLLNRLAVFQGGFTLTAVESICTDDEIDSLDVVDGLAMLVDKSMVNYEPRDERYNLLETVQVFAQQRLEQSGMRAEAEKRHLQWYSQWIDKNYNLAYGPKTSSWFAEIDEELPNLRRALMLGLQPQHQDYGLNLASALTIYWLNRGMVQEARRWINAQIEVAQQSQRAEDKLLAEVLSEGASLAVHCEAYDVAEALMRRSLDIYRQVDRAYSALSAQGNLGVIMTFAGNTAEAITLLEDSVQQLTAQKTSSSDQRLPANRMNLAQALWNDHQDDAAANLLHHALAEWRQIGNPLATAVCLNNLAAAEITLGRTTDAWRHARESLRIRRQVGAIGSYAWSFYIIAVLAASTGELAVAAQLFGAASLRTEASPNARTPRERLLIDATTRMVEERLGQSSFTQLLKQGREADLEAMVDSALSCGPGLLDWMQS